MFRRVCAHFTQAACWKGCESAVHILRIKFTSDDFFILARNDRLDLIKMLFDGGNRPEEDMLKVSASGCKYDILEWSNSFVVIWVHTPIYTCIITTTGYAHIIHQLWKPRSMEAEKDNFRAGDPQ